jgi:hypothetical protein
MFRWIELTERPGPNFRMHSKSLVFWFQILIISSFSSLCWSCTPKKSQNFVDPCKFEEKKYQTKTGFFWVCRKFGMRKNLFHWHFSARTDRLNEKRKKYLKKWFLVKSEAWKSDSDFLSWLFSSWEHKVALNFSKKLPKLSFCQAKKSIKKIKIKSEKFRFLRK